MTAAARAAGLHVQAPPPVGAGSSLSGARCKPSGTVLRARQKTSARSTLCAVAPPGSRKLRQLPQTTLFATHFLSAVFPQSSLDCVADRTGPAPMGASAPARGRLLYKNHSSSCASASTTTRMVGVGSLSHRTKTRRESPPAVFLPVPWDFKTQGDQTSTFCPRSRTGQTTRHLPAARPAQRPQGGEDLWVLPCISAHHPF